MPLRRRLLISALLGTLPLVLLGAVLLIVYYRDVRENVLTQNLALAHVGATYVQVWVDGNLRTLRTLAGANETLRGTPADQQGLIERQLRQQPDWESLFITDANGTILASHFHALIGTTIADRAYFLEARRTRAPSVSNLLVSRATESKLVILAYPIMRNGRFAGVFGVTIPPGEIQNVFKQFHLPMETIVNLLGSDRRLIARTNAPLELIGRKLSGEQADIVFSGRAGHTVTTSPISGRHVIVGYVPVRGTPWTLLISTPLTVVLAPMYRTVGLFLALTFVVLALSLLWSLYSANYLSRLIIALAHGAREIGMGQFGTRVRCHGGPELEELAQSINMMAANLAVIDRLKSDLLTMVSHELKTPLTTIRSSLEMLVAGVVPPDDPRYIELLEMAQRQSLRLQDQIENLLSAARQEAGALDVARRPLTLCPLIKASVAQFEEPASERGLTLTIDLPEDLRVLAEAPKVTLALNNLLDNALKFTEHGGVTVRAVREDDRAVITVTDTGLGLTPEVRAHLFERFYQAEPLLTRKAGGTGLGLFIVNAIAQAHGGRAFAESPGPGKGSTFGFTLPLAEP